MCIRVLVDGVEREYITKDLPVDRPSSNIVMVGMALRFVPVIIGIGLGIVLFIGISSRAPFHKLITRALAFRERSF